MTAAIFGLLGVIVGGVLNGLVTLLLDGHRRKQELRTAARLVIFEFGTCASAIQNALEDERWSLTARDLLRTGHWDGNQALLAAGTDDETWVKLSSAALQIGLVRVFAETVTPDRELVSDDTEWMRGIHLEINEARDSAAPFAFG
jgi:hypothetical protein